MTREEAIARIRIHKNVHKMDEPRAINISEALDMAIKALEQKPCEDAISRQAVDDAIYDYSRACDVDYAQIMEYIDKLPPITPKAKINVLDKIRAEIEMYELDCRLQEDTHECEKCNDSVFGSIYRIIDKYNESEDEK